MTTQKIYLKAIDVNPSNSYAYKKLAKTLPKDGLIALMDGTITRKHQLKEKAKGI